MRLRRALPSSLLLLSRAFTVTAPVAGRPAEADLQMESLKDTLGALNREVVDEVGFEVGDIGCAQVARLWRDRDSGQGQDHSQGRGTCAEGSDSRHVCMWGCSR